MSVYCFILFRIALKIIVAKTAFKISKTINGKTDIVSAIFRLVSETHIYHKLPTMYKTISPVKNASGKTIFPLDCLEMNETKNAIIGYAKIKPPVNEAITLTDPVKPENTGSPTVPSKT